MCNNLSHKEMRWINVFSLLQNIQNQINDQIGDLNKQLDVENDKLKNYSDKMSKLDESVFELKVGNSQKKDITTFKFVADLEI